MFQERLGLPSSPELQAKALAGIVAEDFPNKAAEIREWAGDPQSDARANS
jgi:hypothetical protein